MRRSTRARPGKPCWGAIEVARTHSWHQGRALAKLQVAGGQRGLHGAEAWGSRMHPTMTRVGARPGKAQCPQHSPGMCPMPRPTVPSESPHKRLWQTAGVRHGERCAGSPTSGGSPPSSSSLSQAQASGFPPGFRSHLRLPRQPGPLPFSFRFRHFIPADSWAPATRYPPACCYTRCPPQTETRQKHGPNSAGSMAQTQLLSPPSQALAPKLSSPSSNCCFAELAPMGPAAPCSTAWPASDPWFSAIS